MEQQAGTEKVKIGMLVGPTASGKTAVSIRLAKRMNAEIVSADSIQIYRGMDIGSAKPSIEEREGVPHHLLGAVEIDAPKFSVAEFRRMAEDCIREIAGREKFPLVVGGTGLYVNALTYPLSFTNAPADETLRAQLAAQEAARPGTLYALLQKEDPASAKRLHPNDQKRVMRALEVYRLTGKPIGAHGGDFQNKAGEDIPFSPQIAGLTMPRELLYARIDKRVEQMMADGLEREAREIYQRGYDLALPALQGLGYKQLFRCFRGESTLEQAVEEIKRETRRFAKRQITWFKRDERISWYDVTQYQSADALAEAIQKDWEEQP